MKDEALCDLANNLRETVALANLCPDLKRIEGSVDVIKVIGALTIDIACFVDKYARMSFSGRVIIPLHEKRLSLCEPFKVVRLA